MEKKSAKPIDKVYANPQEQVSPFRFDKQVAGVFDNMVSRSVPQYEEIHQIQVDLICRLLPQGGNIVDLGCSTAKSFRSLLERVPEWHGDLTGWDMSEAMIAQAQESLGEKQNRVHLQVGDVREAPLENPDVVILNYTMQFISLQDRLDLLKRIYNALPEGGVLLLSEKTHHANEVLDQLEQEVYWDYKRSRGYSDLEIAQKREALEEVLVPETLETHLARLAEVGFNRVSLWKKWFNFASFICLK